jgi:hypothetical protein
VIVGGVDLAALGASFRTMPSANGIRELVISTFTGSSCYRRPRSREKTLARAAYATGSPDAGLMASHS